MVPEAQPAAFDLAMSLNNLFLQLSGSGDRAGALTNSSHLLVWN
jgi:hypothetical protein